MPAGILFFSTRIRASRLPAVAPQEGSLARNDG